MIDLKQFCYRGDERPYLQQPWSRGDWSYATNGHTIVRVPRRNDIGVGDWPAKAAEVPSEAEEFFVEVGREGLRPLRAIEWPEPEPEACETCGGSGKEHDDCPHCECKCNSCSGSGKFTPKASVAIDGTPFDAGYIRQIAELPSLRIAAPSHTDDHKAWIFFAFAGGEGVLMGLRSPCSVHVEEASA